MIYVRLINDVYGSFQDLCSLSNISVIVFTHDCRGWYLHGMSPHGPAEVGLMKMTQQLEEEAEDLGKRRGLVENTDDQVTKALLQPVCVSGSLADKSATTCRCLRFTSKNLCARNTCSCWTR